MMPMSKWQRHIKLFYMHYQWVDVIIKRYTAAMAEKRNACAANVSCISALLHKAFEGKVFLSC